MLVINQILKGKVCPDDGTTTLKSQRIDETIIIILGGNRNAVQNLIAIHSLFLLMDFSLNQNVPKTITLAILRTNTNSTNKSVKYDKTLDKTPVSKSSPAGLTDVDRRRGQCQLVMNRFMNSFKDPF